MTNWHQPWAETRRAIKTRTSWSSWLWISFTPPEPFSVVWFSQNVCSGIEDVSFAPGLNGPEVHLGPRVSIRTQRSSGLHLKTRDTHPEMEDGTEIWNWVDMSLTSWQWVVQEMEGSGWGPHHQPSTTVQLQGADWSSSSDSVGSSCWQPTTASWRRHADDVTGSDAAKNVCRVQTLAPPTQEVEDVEVDVHIWPLLLPALSSSPVRNGSGPVQTLFWFCSGSGPVRRPTEQRPNENDQM